MTPSPRLAALLLVTAFSSVALAGQAPRPATAARVTPGELVIDPPTLINLGFEWVMKGDVCGIMTLGGRLI